MTRRTNQKGAALLIVLMLVATLSFIALASTERVTHAAARTVNIKSQGEAMWHAFAVEPAALTAIDQLMSRENAAMTLEDPGVTDPLVFPIDNGVVRIAFADATACFNINSLGAGADGQLSPAAAEFSRLAEAIGIGGFEASMLADAIGDWIDEDTRRRPQGAEDEHYTALPSPYRTGNQLMVSVTELRAVRGFTRELYSAFKPFVCAHGGDEPSAININMLREIHAPVLAAALGDPVTLQGAADLISARPPGGYASVEAFMASPQLAGLERPDASRFRVTSRYVQAHAEIVYGHALLDMTSTIETGGAGARVIARRFGAEE